jgi:hypothetical protein
MTLRSDRKSDRLRGGLIHPPGWAGSERGTQVATAATNRNGPLSITLFGVVHVMIFWPNLLWFIESQTGKDSRRWLFDPVGKGIVSEQVTSTHPGGPEGKEEPRSRLLSRTEMELLLYLSLAVFMFRYFGRNPCGLLKPKMGKTERDGSSIRSEKGSNPSKSHPPTRVDRTGKGNSGRDCCHGPEWASSYIFLWWCSCNNTLAKT